MSLNVGANGALLTGSNPELDNERRLLEEKMEAGVKVKMPSAILAATTRAQNQVVELQRAGGVDEVVHKAVRHFQGELAKLQEAANSVPVENDLQRQAKTSWLVRNVRPKVDYLDKVLAALRMEEDDQHGVAPGDSVSNVGAGSTTSSAQLALAEAEAEEQALELQHQHLKRMQRLHEQERKLQEQRELEELTLRRQQARVRRQALEKATAGSAVHARGLARAHGPEHVPAVTISEPAPCATSMEFVPSTQSAPMSVDPTLGLLQHVLLPNSQLATFKGDPLEFVWFIKAFESQVEAVTQDPVRRLHLLLQHLEGDPHTLVVGCQLEDPDIGYCMAKRTLNEKYGNPVRQALAFKAKLLAWPSIRKDSNADLEKFNIQLQLCQQVKRKGGMADLDAAGTLVQLMNKLPMRLQDRWLKVVIEVETREQREASFADFVKFVKATSDMLNHPIYGRDNRDLGTDSKDSRVKTVKTLATARTDDISTASDVASSAAAKTSEPNTAPSSKGAETHAPSDAFKAPCLFCNGQHATAACKEALKMSREVRRERLKGLCFACLHPGHSARACKKRDTCDKCKGRHPTVLHDEEAPSSGGAGDAIGVAAQSAAETACATKGCSKVAVAVVPIQVWCGDRAKSVEVRAILDPGSTATFISSSLVRRLNLQTKPASLQLTTMTDEKRPCDTTVVAGLQVAGPEGTRLTLPPAFTVSTMPFREEDAPRLEDVKTWGHLKDVPLMHSGAAMELLIGMNAPAALCPLEVRRGTGDEPYAVRTVLGWCINGPLASSERRRKQLNRRAVVNLISAVEPSATDRHIKALHYHDFEGAFDFQDKGVSQEDRKWLDIVSRSIVHNPGHDGRYQIALPFKDKYPPLEDNFDQALQRLRSLKTKFRKNAQFHADYSAFIQKMEDGGYVEEVREGMLTSKPVSYVPHHGVYHPRKPGKIRVVFNCSSRYQGVSLNDCLLSGPDLTNSLVGVLLRFRQERVAFLADIESMFYRVLVPVEQRDALRYLWWPGGELEKEPKIFRLKVHLFGATSSPSCANFALRRAAEDSYADAEINEQTLESVKRNFYVDDCLKSVGSEQEAVELAHALVKACAKGGFKLSKFLSTSVALLKSMKKEELAKECLSIDLEDKNDPLGALHDRALGVMWKVAEDTFAITVADELDQEKQTTTKRIILSKLSAVYDPLGMAAPVLIVARIIFRDLTRVQQLGWDEEVHDDKAEKWNKWLRQLHYVRDVQVRRCYRSPSNCVSERTSENLDQGWQLHIFCDASEEAYAAVAYLRQGEGPDAQVTYLIGKARVAPPKVVTIPRLELTAAKLATDLAGVAGKELQLDIRRRVFWSDSQTVLKYLQNTTTRYHTFVANRVQAILAVSEVSEWRYVPSGCNPADEGSRGIDPQALVSSMWLRGPEFLTKAEAAWPTPVPAAPITDDDVEVKAAAIKQEEVLEESFVEQLATRYSSMSKLRRAVCVWVKFIQFLFDPNHVVDPQMQMDDLHAAETAAIRCLQRKAFAEDIRRLKADKEPIRASRLYKLSPVMSEQGLVMMRSRTHHELPIVPTSLFATRLIEEMHVRQAHFGRQTTAAAVLRKYWVIGLNKLVRQTIKGCPACQRRHARTGVNKMSDLPSYRFKEGGKPFETTGVDYFGPFQVVQGKETMKMYGVIFTCAVTRAVHLEASESLTSGSFWNALRRFVACRGHVTHMVSDNGTNFTGVNAELQRELEKEMTKMEADAPRVSKLLQEKNIVWSFNTPTASHHGGMWERLIRSIRAALDVLLVQHEQRPLTHEGLITLLCETEAILNNRPLTMMSDDPDDFEPLTPNHVLLGHSGAVAPPGNFNQAALRNTWRRVQHLTGAFWRRWTTEYKILLHRRTKWYVDQYNLQMGDVVLVADTKQPRDQWRLGRVEKVSTGSDGRVRTATVRVKGGVLQRPITKLCYLEAASLEARRAHSSTQ